MATNNWDDSVMRLHPEHFVTLHEKSDNNVIYQFIRPIGSPVILFSVTETKQFIPLLAIHFKAQDNDNQNDELGNRGQTFIMKQETGDGFKAMITKGEQDIEFIATNLAPFTDDLIVSIADKSITVKPYDSCVIQFDSNNCLENVRYDVKVFAETHTYVAELLKKTQLLWKCVDYFVVPVPYPYDNQSSIYRSCWSRCVRRLPFLTIKRQQANFASVCKLDLSVSRDIIGESELIHDNLVNCASSWIDQWISSNPEVFRKIDEMYQQ